MKNLVLMMALIMSMFAVSCTSENTSEEDDATAEEVVAFTVENAVEKAGENIDKEIVIEGTVAHVCKHGGKKMFLMGENPDIRIKIVPNEKIASFETDLEGSDVIVTGKVIEKRIDEEYLVTWEEEIKLELETVDETTEHNIEEGNPKHLGVHENTDEEGNGEGNEEEHEEIEDPFAGVKELRKELEESGKEYLSFYSIECSEYKLK